MNFQPVKPTPNVYFCCGFPLYIIFLITKDATSRGSSSVVGHCVKNVKSCEALDLITTTVKKKKASFL